LAEKISIEIPVKLAEFIDNLIEQGYFKSRSDFTRCSMEIIAQLYGLSKTAKKGKSLLDILIDNGKTGMASQTIEASTPKPTKTITKKEGDLSTVEYDLLDLFTGSTFEFEDALYAKYVMESMKIAKTPMPKEEFIKMLEGLIDKKKLERTQHNEKTVWKIIDKY
jgi:Arc/MetJ-type ribon-helix-helix transcriptional regulator